MEARQVAVQRTELEREQKRLDVEEAAQTLANKEELSKVGGVTRGGAVRRPPASPGGAQRIRDDRKRPRFAPHRAAGRGSPAGRAHAFAGPAVANPPARAARTPRRFVRRWRRPGRDTNPRGASWRRRRSCSKALVIDAPAAGIVAAKYVEQGEYVAQNGKLLTLMDTKNVYRRPVRPGVGDAPAEGRNAAALVRGGPLLCNRLRAGWIPFRPPQTPRPAHFW